MTHITIGKQIPHDWLVQVGFTDMVAAWIRTKWAAYQSGRHLKRLAKTSPHLIADIGECQTQRVDFGVRDSLGLPVLTEWGKNQ